MHTILQTQRLIIREFLPEEEDMFLNHYTDEEVNRYLPKRTVAERIDRFRKVLAAYADGKEMGSWGIYDKTDGTFAGSCLLRPFGANPDKTELGYSLERRYWAKGLGTEMARAMVNYALGNSSNAKMVAITELENIGSQRVLEKAGFKRMDNILENGKELAYFEINP